MTAIPSGTKFLGIAASVDTTEKRSKLNNSYQEYYTIQDITGYTETIVNISSAQILAMGTSPIELLPAPGVGKYYELDKIIIEFTEGDSQYNTGTITDLKLSSSSGNFINATIELIQSTDNIVFMSTIPTYTLNQSYYISKNEYYHLTTDDASNPTLGNGTLRVKIYHKTITFGA